MLDYKKILENEIGLDPIDWDNMQTLGQQMVADMFTYFRDLNNQPVWRKPTEEMKTALTQNLPIQTEDIHAVYKDFKKHILPFNKGNHHPRFSAFVQGTGTPFAMLAEMLAAGMNPNVAIGDHSAMYVDKQVIEWAKEMMGFPKTSSGILLSSATMANITAIQIARNAKSPIDMRKEGLQGLTQKMVLYASTETHSCVQKGVEVAGLGSNAIRLIPIDKEFKIDLNALEAAIKKDREAGHLPFCIIANAGTVNTGAIDPLKEIGAICEREDLWFHIDGAFGALANLVPDFQQTMQGLDMADTIAFDFHKWMYMPYEIACLLVKNKAQHRASFALQPSYLTTHERGLAAGPDPYTNYGMELSRGFKSLKVWMSLKEHGIEKFAQMIRQNIAQCFYLGELVEQSEQLELASPVTLNIVCFRYLKKGLDQKVLNHLNREILMELHERGLAAPSYTSINGHYYIRVANTNQRTRKADFEALIKDVINLGEELS